MAERTYRIHVAAELSGVRVELIRAWERRYQVPQPQRTPSGYREYTERDVALLKRLKQLTDEGVSISQAVRMLPELLAEIDGQMRPVGVGAEPGRAARSLEVWRKTVLTAAESYDQYRVSAVVDEVLAALPPLKAFDEVLAPLQHEVGNLWHAGTLSVAQEHMVSQVVRTRMMSLLHAAPEGRQRHALLACFPDEEHELGLLGVALRLRYSGFRVTLLGPRVPVADLGRAVMKLRPDLVGLSAVVDPGAEAFAHTLGRVVEALPLPLRVWVGGAAATAHAEVCAKLGTRLFTGSEDWLRLLE